MGMGMGMGTQCRALGNTNGVLTCLGCIFTLQWLDHFQKNYGLRYVGALVPFLNWTLIFNWYVVHNTTLLMSCVHGPCS